MTPLEKVGIYMLDVGQGDATIVLLPNPKRAVLFDCRDAHVATMVLEHWRIEHLHLVVSHLDIDHIAGVAEILTHFRKEVRAVFLTVDRPVEDASPDAATARKVIDTALAADRSWRLFDAKAMPASIVQEDGCSVSIIAPEADVTLAEARSGQWEDANRHSAVLRVEYGGKAVLIGADAPLTTWASIPAGQRRAAVFRTPHHGGALDDGGIPAGWTVDKLYQEAQSEDAVISVGTMNGHGHPNPDWIGPVMRGACRLRCTQVTKRCEPSAGEAQAALRDIVVPDGLSTWTSSHHAEAPWRHLTKKRGQRSKFSEIPCAGTVVVTIEGGGQIRVVPSPEALDPVVQLWVHPLCQPEP